MIPLAKNSHFPSCMQDVYLAKIFYKFFPFPMINHSITKIWSPFQSPIPKRIFSYQQSIALFKTLEVRRVFFSAISPNNHPVCDFLVHARQYPYSYIRKITDRSKSGFDFLGYFFSSITSCLAGACFFSNTQAHCNDSIFKIDREHSTEKKLLFDSLKKLVASNTTLDGKPLKKFQKIGLLFALGTQNQKNDYFQKAYAECNQAFSSCKEGFSYKKTEKYRDILGNIRKAARKDLSNDETNTKQVCQKISQGFLDLAKLMLEDALEHLKIPQCSYSFIALGSLARQEQTPYSDLEFAVIVDKSLSDEEKAQFIKISDWLHFQILLMGETPLAELGIEGIYDRKIIKKGFSLDGPNGKMAPSWNPNLVGMADELLKYQDKHFFIDNMIIPGELRNVVTICGSQLLTENYQNKLLEYLNEVDRKDRALHLLEVDGDRFTARGGKVEENGRVIPIKYDLYRAIQLRVEGISLYYGLKERNIFDRIRKLESMDILPLEFAQNLSKTAAAILRLRNGYYIEKEEAAEDTPIKDMSSYLTIYQTLIPFEAATESFVYGQEKEAAFQIPLKYSEDLTYGFLHQAFGQLEKASKYFNKALEENNITDELKLEVMLRLWKCTYGNRKHEDSLKYLEEAEKLLHLSSLPTWIQAFSGAAVYSNRAVFYSDCMDFENAQNFVDKAYKLLQKSEYSETYFAAMVKSNIGTIFCRTKDFKKGAKALTSALQIEEKFSKSHSRRALVLYNRGTAHYHLGEYQKAWKDFEESEKISRRVSGEAHISIARALKGKALYYSGGPHKDCAKSLVFHQEALKKYLECEEDCPHEIITQYCNIGVAQGALGNATAVKSAFSKAEDLIKQMEYSARIWKDFYSQKGNAFFNIKNYQTAAKSYKKALDIWNKEKKRLDFAAPFESVFRHQNYGMSLAFWACELASDIIRKIDQNLKPQRDLYGNIEYTRQIFHESQNQFQIAIKFYEENNLNCSRLEETKKNLSNIKKQSKEFERVINQHQKEGKDI